MVEGPHRPNRNRAARAASARAIVVACALVALSLVVPTRARASCDCNAGGCPALLGFVIAAPVQGTSTLLLGSADIAFAAQQRWLPPPWAWTQLILGTLANGAAGVVWTAAADCESEAIYPVFAVASFALATWFAIDAVLSLLMYEPPREPAAVADRQRAVFW